MRIRSIGSAVVTLAALAWGGPAGALTFLHGPLLQQVTDTQIQVLWELDQNVGGGAVAYGLGGATNLTQGVDGPPLYYNYWTTSCLCYEGGYLYAATLGGLKPSSVYTYQVQIGGISSPTLTFVTAPDTAHATEPLSFVVYGDNRRAAPLEDLLAGGGTDSDHRSVVAAVEGEVPDFLLSTGDLALDGTSVPEFENFFAIEDPLIGNVCFFPAFGNHDLHLLDTTLIDPSINPPLWEKYLSVPREYAFRYGNVYFIALNTEALDTNFLSAELAQAAADPVVQHTFVYAHKPAVVATDDALLDTYMGAGKLRAAFLGHDHVFRIDSSAGGLTKFVTGGGGAPFSILDPANERYLNYVKTTVSGMVVSFQVKKPDGTVVNSWSVDFSNAGATPGSTKKKSGGGCSSTPEAPGGWSLLALLLPALYARRRSGAPGFSRR